MNNSHYQWLDNYIVYVQRNVQTFTYYLQIRITALAHCLPHVLYDKKQESYNDAVKYIIDCLVRYSQEC